MKPVLLVVACLCVAPGVGPASARQELRSDVQQAFDRGMAAAEQQEYALAIRHFTEARKLAPYVPAVLFNLGLAESKMPGRELRAIAWLRAYLLMAPDAANGAAVRRQIASLQVRAEATTAKLVAQAFALAKGFAPKAVDLDSRWYYFAVQRQWNMQLAVGDLAGARLLEQLIPAGSDWKATARKDLAVVLAKGGDFVSAQIMANDISSPGDADNVFQEIACAQARSGKTPGALFAIKQARVKDDTLRDLARIEAEKARPDDARRYAEQIGDAAIRAKVIQDLPAIQPVTTIAANYVLQMAPIGADWLQIDLAVAMAKSGDVAGAKREALAMGPRAGGALERIAQIQIERSDFVQAKATVASIEDQAQRDHAYAACAAAQAGKGDFAGASETATLIKDDGVTITCLIELAAIQAKAKQPARAKATLDQARRLAESASDVYKKVSRLAAVANGLALIKEPAAARETVAVAIASVEAIADRDWRCFALGDIAEARARVGDIAGARQSAETAAGIKPGYGYSRIVEVQVANGDIAGANETAALSRSDDVKAYLQKTLALSRAGAGNLPGAWRAADAIADAEARAAVYVAVGQARAERKDAAGATASFDRALKAANLGTYYLCEIAAAKAASGDGVGARQFLETLLGRSDWSLFEREKFYEELAGEFAARGDISGVKQTIDAATADRLVHVKANAWFGLVEGVTADLNTPLFLDQPNYLQGIAAKTDPGELFSAIAGAVEKLVQALTKVADLTVVTEKTRPSTTN